MVVTLPKDFGRMSMYRLLDEIIDEDLQPRADEIIFDFKTLQFVKPVGVTVLSNLVAWLNKKGVVTKFIADWDRYRDPISYLDDSLFFQQHINKKIKKSASPRVTTIPLQHVKYQSSYQWMENNFLTWISNRLSLTRASLADIKVCIEEIFNNINDHAEEQIGCVFAQHYPNLNSIRIAISDFGVGIPNRVQRKHPSLSDGEALQKAIQQGFTTRSIPRNSGAGLDVLIRNVVNNNKGSVYIHSNSGILSCTHRNREVRIDPVDHESFYPGTLIEIVLRTDTIENVSDIEEEFEW